MEKQDPMRETKVKMEADDAEQLALSWYRLQQHPQEKSTEHHSEVLSRGNMEEQVPAELKVEIDMAEDIPPSPYMRQQYSCALTRSGLPMESSVHFSSAAVAKLQKDGIGFSNIELSDVIVDYFADSDDISDNEETSWSPDEVEDEQDDYSVVKVDDSRVEAEAAYFVENAGKTDVKQCSDFTCSCKLHNNQPCSLLFSQADLHDLRNCHLALQRDELDLVLLSHICAGIHDGKTTMRLKQKKQTERKRIRVDYYHKGRKICRDTFFYTHGVSKDRLTNLVSHYQQHGITVRTHGNKNCLPKHALTFQERVNIVRFIQNYAEQHAVLLPGRIPGYPGTDLKLLPSSCTKVSLYEFYTKSCRDANLQVVAQRTFCELWQTYVPEILSMKPSTDLCLTCRRNSALLNRSANVSEEEKLELITKARNHVEHAFQEREEYNRIKKKARDFSAKEPPTPVPLSVKKELSAENCIPTFHVEEPSEAQAVSNCCTDNSLKQEVNTMSAASSHIGQTPETQVASSSLTDVNIKQEVSTESTASIHARQTPELLKRLNTPKLQQEEQTSETGCEPTAHSNAWQDTRTSNNINIKMNQTIEPFTYDRQVPTIVVRSDLKHTVEKPYTCDFCDATFTRAQSAKIHMRRHTGERPFPCDQCDAKFTQSGSLKKHIRLHTGEKPFVCKECSAAFKGRWQLKEHVLTHTGEKPYACKQCDATFRLSGHLKTHTRKHTGQKPFQCQQCDAAFRQSGHLKTHMLKHTREKPYPCKECNAAFTRNGHLKKHMLTHIGIKPYATKRSDANAVDSLNNTR